ncbi:protein cueball isoform X2 [Cotesia glomerata]|uniref:protein cueball isoform X2 n=1 Tax=Cotesia glomerata TaxID=32391 RepID=UPI001D00B102|nr:protein cueball isoform X2 [Cotesia glomerata]
MLDVAVTIGREVNFFSSNGTLLRRIKNRDLMGFSGIAFDQISHMLFLGDSSNNAVKIYSKDLQSKDPEMNILLDNKVDTRTMMDMAYDQSSQSLFWTDNKKRAIFKMNINFFNTSNSPEIILYLINENPQGISIDLCHQRLYWANSNKAHPSISSSKLDGTDYTVVINKDLYRPVAVTVDHLSNKLYWIEYGEGIHFNIERSNLDGTSRELLINRKHQQPFNIAVDDNRIYWSDWVYKAVWSINKNVQGDKVPKIWKSFRNHNGEANPTSIITYNNIAEVECIVFESEPSLNRSVLSDDNEKYNVVMESNEEHYGSVITNAELCLNDGYFNNITNTCQCKLGFNGDLCEKSVCDNWCVHGECSILFNGKPDCKCHLTHQGLRCEEEICFNYCFNDGECTIHNNKPVCSCKYSQGPRCEEIDNVTQLCTILCTSPLYTTYEKVNNNFCRCSRINSTADLYDKFINDSWAKILTIALLVIIGILLILIVILSYFVNKFRCRPLIKKRFVISKKGITPLTSRPRLSSDQCEIMIEDCCNMNICETPCYEPKAKNQDLKEKKVKGRFHC